jgi:hypothetical protein
LTNFAGQPAYYAGRTGAGRADAGVRGGSVTRALERGGSVTRALADVGRKILGGTYGGGGGSRKQRLALGESNDFEFNVAQVPSSTEPGSRADGHNGPHGGMDEDEDEDNVARSMLFSSLGAEPSGIGADEDGQASDDGRRENSESESDDDEDVDGSAPVFSSAASLAANKRFAQVVEACQALPAAFGRAVLTEPAFGAALARRPLLAARLFVCWQLGHAQRATDLALMAGTQHLALAALAAAVAARAGIAVARSPIIVATCSKDALRLAKAAEAASERAAAAVQESAAAAAEAERESISASAMLAKALASASSAAAAAGGDARNKGATAAAATPTVSLRRLKAARAEAEADVAGPFGAKAVALRRRGNAAKAQYAHAGLAIVSSEAVLASVLLRMREREQYPGPLRAVRFMPRLARGSF